MIELVLTPDAEEYGKRRKRGYDRRGIKDAFRGQGRDKRWTGHAVEYELHRWLTDSDIPHRWNYEGLGNLPDFEIAGLNVAVKANSGDGPRDDFLFTVPEHHVGKLGNGVLFCIIQIRERKVWIAGYLDARKFRQSAERHAKGDEGFIAERPFEYACRTIRADALEPAETFFGLLKVACA